MLKIRRFKSLTMILSLTLSLMMIPTFNSREVKATTYSQEVESELNSIVSKVGQDNVVFENGVVLNNNEEVSLNTLIENDNVKWYSNNEEIVALENGNVVGKSEGTTFLIGEIENKFHIYEIYISDNSMEISQYSDMPSERKTQYVVYVDPGHGGSDPGAIGYGYNEKDLVLTVSRKLKSRLEAAGIKVVMSRDSDVYVSLKERSGQANSIMPDIFISVHMNAFNSQAKGIETLYYKNIDIDLANLLQSNLIRNTGAIDRRAKFQDLHVTRETKMPASLVECGFIDNGEEVNLLRNDAYQNKLADAMTTGAIQYLERNVQLDKTPGRRVAGNDRYDTSRRLFNEGWTSSETVILADGLDYPDALSASPLAGKYNAPILLTEKKSLNSQPELVSLLKSKGVKNAYIIGGFNALPGMIDNELKSMGITVKRIGGNDRYETSVMVARELGNVNEVVVTYGLGFADSLSISSVAAIKGMPIILTATNELSNVAKEYIQGNSVIKSYVIGSTGVVSSNVEASLPNPERLGGANRYETNKVVFDRFKNELTLDEIFIASAVDFPDALSGSALATRKNSFVVLSNAKAVEPATMELISNNRQKINNVIILGGESAITSEVIYRLGIRL